jgi:hypothetical protein
MNERERIEAVYELGGTKATYGHEDIIVIVPPFFLLLDCIGNQKYNHVIPQRPCGFSRCSMTWLYFCVGYYPLEVCSNA